MKITAIRLEECGRFREPAALERLSGGLDVLCGPNEAGKSTILKALRLVITEKHTSRAREIEALRPYQGGAPLIEVDFETGGRRYRITKRFLAQRMAELRGMDDGNLARGADAEARLAEILGGRQGEGLFPFLWVEQGGTLEPFDMVRNGTGDLLRAAIAQDVQSIAGGEDARRVRAHVRKLLGELVSEQRQNPRGRFEAALRQYSEIEQRYRTAQERLDRVESQIEQLEKLRGRMERLTAPDAASLRRDTADRARSAWTSAQAAIQHRDKAELTRKAALSVREAAARDLGDFERAVAALDEFVKGDETDAGLAADLEARIDGLLRTQDIQRAAVAASHTAIETLNGELSAALEQERRQQAELRHAELEKQQQAVLAALEKQQEIRHTLAGNSVSEDMVRNARRENAAAREINAALDAAAASVAIRYLPGRASRMRTGGRALADGEILRADAPLVIEVEGIGEIAITPGARASLQEMRANLATHQRNLSEILAGATADDLTALEARLKERQVLEAGIRELEAHIRALAPQGLDQMRGLLAEAKKFLLDIPVLEVRPRPVVESDIRQRRSVQAEEERVLSLAGEQLADLRVQRSEVATRMQERARQRAALESALPAPGLRADHAAALKCRLDDATASENAAIRAVAAWREQAPDADGLRGLEAAVQAAEDAINAAGREQGSLSTEIARIEGELATLRNDDVEMQAAALVEALASARAEVARIKDEVAALSLIDTELAAEEAAIQDRYQAPIVSRIGPYLNLVFPDATLTLDPALRVNALVRNDRSEAEDKLSDGTREQIALLTRLAFARLLADGGHPVPLILDDALVYSDDDRIGRMFRALEQAARWHQVIVLTCRSRTFEMLGGQRVVISPWKRG